MMRYSAYGLILASDFELPPLAPMASEGQSDIQIVRERVDPAGLNAPRRQKALSQVSPGIVWMDVPNIARFAITDGNKIAVDLYADADENSVALYLLGSALGAILHQRGYLVLHATAIKAGSGAFLCAGHSGVGKSTIAATFHQKGFDVLSDDIVAINRHGNVVGGFPQIKLWQDTLTKLGLTETGLRRIRNNVNKYSYPLTETPYPDQVPTLAIYCLDVDNRLSSGEFRFSVCSGLSKFDHLNAYVYRSNFMEGLGLQSDHLANGVALARQVHMASISRSAIGFNATELAELILSDLSDAGLNKRLRTSAH